MEESPLQVLNIDIPRPIASFRFRMKFNGSNVQSCCRPAVASFAMSGRQGFADP
jgi:hypothetical protein